MTSKNCTKKTYNNIKNRKYIGYYIPIIFIIVIVPLIVRGKMIELPVEVANFWKGGTNHMDLFSYYKAIAFTMGTIAAICSFMGLYLNSKLIILREPKYYIPMITYIIFAIVSTVLSKNKYVAINGFMEINQGIFVLISYITITFILMNYIKDYKDIRIVIHSILAVTFIEGLIGLTQYFGFDIFQSSLGKWLILPQQLKNMFLSFTFGSYTIYGTLYNTNFVGSFATLVLPISFVSYLYSKKVKTTIISAIASILAFILWVGCNSRAGFLGIMVSFILGLILFRKEIRNKYKKIILIFFVYLIILISFNKVSDGKVLTQFFRVIPSTEFEKINKLKSNVRFEEVSINNNVLKIKTNTEELTGSIINNVIKFQDGSGNNLNVIKGGNEVTFTEKKYGGYSFYVNPEKPYILKANIYGRILNLYAHNGEMKVISINNKLSLPVEAPRVKLFDGIETFASNRGYIWSRTIPMIKDTIIIGYGPDNYALQFPQDDYVGKFNTGENMSQTIIDKPHNLFMQTAINTGGISLIALVTIWIIYLTDCIKIYFTRRIDLFIDYIGGAIFLSVTGYLVAGVFNDNIISVAPLFWVILGTGIGINNMIKNNYFEI